ncbi:keratin-associated protein 9-1-like [Argopecten irradians]|uniref:keratin-associated protein 9-1-like n=1 Tax=Argopecten irradians TaxID=31199 RepID=UPI003722DE46
MTTSVVSSTTSTNAATTSTDPADCAPTVCPDATIIPSTCDPACVFQCCNGSHVEHCCDPGYYWSHVDNNCQKVVHSTTTSSPTLTSPVNCDAPSTCTHGTFLADPCDDQCFYNCGHGIAYHTCCAAGRVWDNYIKDCNYRNLYRMTSVVDLKFAHHLHSYPSPVYQVVTTNVPPLASM